MALPDRQRAAGAGPREEYLPPRGRGGNCDRPDHSFKPLRARRCARAHSGVLRRNRERGDAEAVDRSRRVAAGGSVSGFDVMILPAINATLNGIAAVLLLVGFYLIRQKKWKM